MKIVVIGGGLAGLVFSYESARRGARVTILEGAQRPGGLLRSAYVHGYTFDSGGSHIIFSRDRRRLEYLLRIVGHDNLIRHRRDTRVYYRGKYVKYPFENGIYMLPPRERYEILRDMVQAFIARACGELEPPRNFGEWLRYVFGNALSSKYLAPYNEKLWKRDLSEISLEWVGGRVPNPPIEDVMKSAVGIPTEGYTHQLNFYYPRERGIEMLVEALRERAEGTGRVRVICGARVEEVESLGEEGVRVHTEDGRSFDGDYVVSTAPLPETVRMLREVPGHIRRLVENLDYNSLVVVGVGGRARRKLPYHWVYFPQKDISFHRLAFLSNYSPRMAPHDRVSFLAEISVRGDAESLNQDSVARKVLEDLEFLGLISANSADVVETWTWKYAYVVYRHGYSETVRRLRRFLVKRKVIPLGRFGEWAYINMDETAHRARVAASRLARGGEPLHGPPAK